MYARQKHIALTLLALLCCALSTMAQKKVYVRGYVIDEQKHALDLVDVLQLGTSNGTITNEQGYYELQCTCTDSITLRFSFIGYETVTRTFAPGSQLSINLSVTLPSASNELSELEVRSYQRNENTMLKIDTKQLQLVPDASGGGVEGLIKLQGGVSSHNELSSQYSVRGGSYDENCIYVNGIEIYRPLLIRSGQQEGMSFINSDMVESVNFSAGGFSAQYGDKMSSVLDVTYKKPEKFEASVSASLLGATAYIGSKSKRFTQIHGFRYHTSQYLLGSLDTKGSYDTWFLDYQTYMTLALSQHWSLEFLGNISQNTYRFRPSTTDVSFGTTSMARNLTIYYDGQERDRFRTMTGALGLRYQLTPNTSFVWSVSAFNTNELENYDIIGEYLLSELSYDENGNMTTGEELGTGTYHQHARNRLSATVANVSLKADMKVGATRMLAGVSYQREMITDRIQEWERRDSADYSLPYDPNAVQLSYNLTSAVQLTTSRLQGYIEDTYRYEGDKLTWNFNGGIRLNYWSFNKNILFSPRFSIALLPHWKHDMTFRLAAGLYCQAPFYKEIRKTVTDPDGNNFIELNHDVDAQKSINVLFGYDYYFRLWNRPFKFSTEAYYKYGYDIISYSVDNMQVRYSGENDAIANTMGIDFKLFGEFVPGTDSWISFSLMRSKEDLLNDHYKVYSNTGAFLGDVYPGAISRPNEQRYSVSIFFQDYLPNHPEYRMYLKFIWADGLPFGPPNSQRYEAVFRSDPYRRVDIGFSRGFMKGREKFMTRQNVVQSWWINLEIFNLLNIKNENSYYWFSDIYGNQYAAPNYLTGIMPNLKIVVNF
ncbi:MAG: TonB-dependent receptor [Bacteroidales bacterium]|nr:TonB-dependent receptor [Bacteroidales bacterium]